MVWDRKLVSFTYYWTVQQSWFPCLFVHSLVQFFFAIVYLFSCSFFSSFSDVLFVPSFFFNTTQYFLFCVFIYFSYGLFDPLGIRYLYQLPVGLISVNLQIILQILWAISVTATLSFKGRYSGQREEFYPLPLPVNSIPNFRDVRAQWVSG